MVKKEIGVMGDTMKAFYISFLRDGISLRMPTVCGCKYCKFRELYRTKK